MHGTSEQQEQWKWGRAPAEAVAHGLCTLAAQSAGPDEAHAFAACSSACTLRLPLTACSVAAGGRLGDGSTAAGGLL